MFTKISLIFVISAFILCVNGQPTTKPDVQPKKIEDVKPESVLHDQVKEVVQKVATTEVQDGENPFPYTTDSSFTDNNDTTTAPSTTSTSKPTPPPPTTSTTSPNSTSTEKPTTLAPSTPTPASTTSAPNTTSIPATTTAVPPKPSQRFDFPSFIGGVMLTLGLLAIGFVSLKFYKARTDRNYHTL